LDTLTTPIHLTPDEFFRRHHVNAAYTHFRLAHPQSDDLSTIIESPFAPEVTSGPPEFDDVLLVEVLIEEHLDESGDPEWMHDFHPGIGQALACYRAMVDASGLHGDLPYFGGF